MHLPHRWSRVLWGVGMILAWGSGFPAARAADVYISEFMAVNDGSVRDVDGDSSDWIELYNASASPVNLNGWFLTDRTNDLVRWAFPAVTLQPGAYLVVFASDKNRRDPAAELHTNFKLSGAGGYLALVRPNLAVEHAYAPGYPPQEGDVSYGIDLRGTPLLQAGATAFMHVPTNDAAGTAWRAAGYEMSELDWGEGNTGIGFGLTVPGLTVTFIKANAGEIGGLSTAEAIVDDPGLQTYSTTVVASVVNYLNTGGGANFGGDVTFPSLTINQDVERFVVEATGSVYIPSAGWWSFGVNSDDGFRLELNRGSSAFSIEFASNRGPGDTLGQFNVTEPGWYELRLIYWENGGGSEVELFAAQGLYTTFNASAFRLVGDTGGGGLQVRTQVGGGSGGVLVQTDVSAQMLGTNATAYLRIPFTVSATNAFSSLRLYMRYNDGFAAYLNGTSVAWANVPVFPMWNSAATASRTVEQTLAPQTFDLTAHLDSLVAGENWLAVHGMNVSAADGTFLVLPELFAGSAEQAMGYFSPATPRAANGDPYLFGSVGDTKFSVDRGFFTNAFEVAITCDTEDAEIRYTLDGSWPGETNGTVYTAPLTIDRTTVLRAAAFKAGHIPSDVDTMTYLFLNDVVQQTEAATLARGFPNTWITTTPDYGMDTDVIGPGDLYGGVYAATIRDDLRAAATISVVADLNDLFGPSGVYANPTMTGPNWERRCSVELLDPQGQEAGFQVNCGVRIQGGAFREWGLTKKKSFRLLFKNKYGAGKLTYPLFGDEAIGEFDTITLRAEANDGYAWGGYPEVLYLRDEWARQTQRELGQTAPCGRSVHVYLNGVYWGLYNVVERPDQGFGEAYFDVPKELWDGLNSGEVINADGDYIRQQRATTAWNTLISLCQAVANATDETARSAALQRLQGRNPDGTDNPAWECFLDVDSLIDYYIVNLYGGNDDWPWHNWYAGRENVPDSTGWKFFCWDTERIMDLPKNVDAWLLDDTNGPGAVLNHLRSSAEFRQRFADRLHRAFFNGGPLYVDPSAPQWDPAHPERNRPAARFVNLVNRVRSPLVAESARWGDQHQEPPLTVRNQFDAEADYLLQSYFPARSALVLQRFRNANLYPNVTAPSFSPRDGLVAPGSTLRLSAQAGTVYYTFNGEDPRLPGGGINPAAVAVSASGGGVHTLVSRQATWRYLDDGSNQGTAWRHPTFDDSSWKQDEGVFGYEDGQDTIISYGPDPSNKYITYYFRRSFVVQDPGAYDAVTIGLRRDDGAVVYLNGEELFRDGMEEGVDVNFQTLAETLASGSGETTYFAHAVDPSRLSAGTNYLAVEVHQITPNSTDVSFDLEMTATSTAATDIPIPCTGTLQARVWDGASWSALNEATYVVDVPIPLQVSECMVNARLPEGAETNLLYAAEDYEWIEMVHTGAQVYGLAGLEFGDGIEFRFADGEVRTVAPGERVVVVANRAAFEARYPAVDPARVAGAYTGSLNNGGEDLAYGVPLQGLSVRVPFGSGREWPLKAAGAGHSLVPLASDADELEYGPNWQASAYRDGSPGAPNPAPFEDVIINEIAAHTDYYNPARPEYDSNDWIELFNAGTNAVGLGSDWYVSDDINDLRKAALSPAVLASGAWKVLDEINDFHTPITQGFGLDKAGEQVFLSYLPGNAQDRVADAVRFKGQENGRTLGRYPDGVPGDHTLSPTPGGPNQLGPPDLRITEIMFHPLPTAAHPEDNENDEFVEIFNPTTSPVAIDGWRLTDDVEYVFPAGTVIGAGKTLVVVSFHPTNAALRADFLAAYGLAEGAISLTGAWEGKLSNRGGRVALERPQAADLPGDLPSWVIVDEVFYFDRRPWPSTADASGQSLHVMGPNATACDGAMWEGALPSPGSLDVAPHDAALRIEDVGSTFLLRWDPLPGVPYQVEWRADLDGPIWTPLGTVQTNGPASWLDTPPAPALRGFYRLSWPR